MIDRRALEQCWAELKPAMDEIAQLVQTAPLSHDDRARLAACVAAHSFGMTAAAMGLSPNDVEEVTAYIGAAHRKMAGN